MILSKRTLDLLTICQKINPSIFIEKGRRLRTIQKLRSFLLVADIDEKFPCDVPIYNLKEFIDVIKEMNNPNIEFLHTYKRVEDQEGPAWDCKQPVSYLLFNKGASRFKQEFDDPSFIAKPNKEIDFPKTDFSFYLFKDVLQKWNNQMRKQGLWHLELYGCDKTKSLFGKIHNPKNYDSKSFSTKVGEGIEINRPIILHMSLLKLLPVENYNVHYSSSGIFKFETPDTYLRCYIPSEPVRDEEVENLKQRREVDTMID